MQKQTALYVSILVSSDYPTNFILLDTVPHYMLQ